MTKLFIVGIAFLGIAAAASASPAKIVHQSTGAVIVRLGADGNQVVWQEVGDKKSDHTLYAYDAATGVKSEISSPKRPFGPAVSGGYLLYGAGRLNELVEVYLTPLTSRKSLALHKSIPWIVEPAIQVRDGKLRALWERSDDIDGNGLSIYMYELSLTQGAKGEFKVLSAGPVLRRDELPKEAHRAVHNEYPEISGDSIAFQNNEYGMPNVYRLDMSTKQFTRLSPSQFHQERPAIDNNYVVWEESEQGFGVSNESSIFAHDARTGQVRKLNPEKGFHYQARVFGRYAIYGAKREPMPHTPSVRVYDLEKNVEMKAETCFQGSIYDWAPVRDGVYAAQRLTGSASRVLFATWEQLALGCL